MLTLMMIDSLHMTAEDRELIASQSRAATENQIIITHGTDAVAVTAEMLAEKGPGKTIVLTGAMIPYKFGSSDEFFNLGSALAVTQSLTAGVYVAMSGQYFNADHVCKNKKTGEFEDIA